MRGSEFSGLAAGRVSGLLPGVDIQSMELGFSLERAANAHMQQSESSVHRALGISWSAFRVLYIIWILDEVEARDVTRISGATRQATSAVLKQLETNGLVTRTRKSPGGPPALGMSWLDAPIEIAADLQRRERAWMRLSDAMDGTEAGEWPALLTRVALPAGEHLDQDAFADVLAEALATR
ncbi:MULTISPECIES: MarR family winged helix-turn-helix transcriptional regulator [unclassified Nocardioides]|uniref:MarR family winged helix-turn-helix transcriptional regulator n=1 Tax=unclassified Nocardioides TaxID=2615069 RepID=UPI0013FD77B8|nr:MULTISPECIES: MarR family transcriptional regulator [unclassified Nocardioides]